MFRKMRRMKQLLPDKAAKRLLKNGTTGVLGVCGDDGYPYTVPLNYVYENNALYFHCAKTGHKMDAIQNSSKVSFCVIERDEVVAQKLTTYFRSVIVFGKAAEILDNNEKLQAMQLLNQKYAPEFSESGDKEIQREWNVLSVVKIEVEHLTGKEAIELVKQPGL